ncbi:hypothetical protein WICPIJ_007021 [Wickerhamomyces pijperi]|uniref:Uncharacterized protein n=1 Tax=Wickerhamomyces pijperi TaxID=599730 RepID=A0A9P8Q374_WICPI|nr:hypothetical protein WICPIJ_007021 [Wickerhamomyces pijperi]
MFGSETGDCGSDWYSTSACFAMSLKAWALLKFSMDSIDLVNLSKVLNKLAISTFFNCFKSFMLSLNKIFKAVA